MPVIRMAVHDKPSVNDNAYKDSAPLLPPMTYDEEKHTNEINKNSYNITHITHMLDRDIIFEDRRNFNIYSSKGTWKDFVLFCKTLGKPVCEVHDKLLLYGMMVIPNKTILMDITFKVNEKKPVQVEIKDSLLCHKLESWHDRVLEANQGGSAGTSNGSFVKLLERLEEAAEFNNPSPRLVALMEKCKVLI